MQASRAKFYQTLRKNINPFLKFVIRIVTVLNR